MVVLRVFVSVFNAQKFISEGQNSFIVQLALKLGSEKKGET